ncbi:MAG: hypothetical protein A4E32_00322 [Methanomassiliicoccales archaeon PtaU1.Bin124]|nr:MAG: hypothetical protein A4E32_00322 [Methanomassiliicoccales archaeon PtaU1.Bin124]
MWGRKKEEEPKDDYVKACPRCSSRNLVMEPGVSLYIILGHIYQYRCKDCGYFGPNFDMVNVSKDHPVEPEKAQD